MADQDFKINVITQYDGGGLRKLSDDIDSIQARTRKGGAGSSLLAPIPEELMDGAPASTKEVAENISLAGANMTRLRQESIIWARELATGAPTIRTLSSLLGALPLSFAAAAVGGFALNRALTAYGEEQVRINKEVDDYLSKLTEGSHKWTEIAKAATSMEDVQKVATSALPAVEEIAGKINALQKQTITGWKQLVDIMTTVPGISMGFFAGKADAEMKRLLDIQQQTDEAAARAIKLGTEYRNAFKGEQAEPILQAMDEATAKITKLTDEQNKLATWSGTYLQDWHRIQGEIDIAKSNLTKLVGVYEQIRKAADAAAAPLARGLRQSSDAFIGAQREAEVAHQANRAALEQKRREAVASGDTSRARAISDELKDDKFNRDLRKEQLQRYVANQESLLGMDTSQQNQLKQFGKEGLRQFEKAQAELTGIYGQQKAELGKDHSGDILTTLRLILQQFQ